MRPFLTLHNPAGAAHYYEQGFWQRDTFYGLLQRHAAGRPNASALQDGRRRLSWAEVIAWVDGVAADLRTYGLRGGDRVSIWASNRIETVVMFLACSREGFACNPSLHRTYTCAEIGVLMERLSTRCLLTEPDWGSDRKSANFDGILTELPSLRVVYTPDSFPRPGPYLAPPVTDPDKVAYLAFTSGTTGAPKCVMHSDNTLLANARDLIRDWGHGPGSVILTLSPLSHHISWVAVAQWLLSGGRLVTDDPPPGMSHLDWLLENGATYALGVPTHARDILAEQRKRRIDGLGALKSFYMAGSDIPPALAEAFLAQGVTPQNVYGMTENSSHQYTSPTDDRDVIVSTCGRGGRAYQIRLFDPADQDRPVRPGEIGHIGGKGATLMLGYFDDQAATESSFNSDGWFMSGDLGVLDASGNLRVEGRIKDLIIRGGHNINPLPIETLAMRHRDVAKAACFPVADERLGERVCIAVTGKVEPEALLRHLAGEGLSTFHMPEYFVRVADLPLTASGKVMKRALVDMMRQGELTPTPIRYRAPEALAS
jgi:acyl-CoA synthetase